MVITFEIILFISTLLLEQKDKFSISFKTKIILLFILYLLYISSFNRSMNYVIQLNTSPRFIIIGYNIKPDLSNTTF